MTPGARLVTVLVVLGSSVLIAWWTRRGTAVRRRRWTLPGDQEGPLLFTSTTCATCGRARRVLDTIGLSDVTEVVWDNQADLFDQAGVDKVPVLMWVDSDGQGWRVDGVAGVKRLRRWMS